MENRLADYGLYEKIFYIIRHGETDYNQMGIVQGRGINTDLNETGQLQARQFFEKYKHIGFDKVYTSLLKRTHQTVQDFVANGIEWEQLEGFDELGWGINEGKSHKTVFAESFKDLFAEWSGGNYEAGFTNGESPLEVRKRQQKAVDYVLTKKEERNILICTHGRAMRILMCGLLNVELKNMDTFEHQNTSLYVLGYKDGEFKLLKSNCIEHLTQTKSNDE